MVFLLQMIDKWEQAHAAPGSHAAIGTVILLNWRRHGEHSVFLWPQEEQAKNKKPTATVSNGGVGGLKPAQAQCRRLVTRTQAVVLMRLPR
jgi:hypothetical protein